MNRSTMREEMTDILQEFYSGMLGGDEADRLACKIMATSASTIAHIDQTGVRAWETEEAAYWSEIA